MLVEKNTMANLCDELRTQGKRIVFTNGCFDILHSGHTFYLDEARKLGDVLIIGLNSDESVKRLKGEGRPVNNQSDRQRVLSALKAVDFVVFFDEDTPFNLIAALKPDCLVKGGDYTQETIVGADIVQSYGGEVVTVPLVPNKSTTNIINKMKL